MILPVATITYTFGDARWLRSLRPLLEEAIAQWRFAMQEGLKIVEWHFEFERKQGEYGG
jgi:hypothetical protein